MLAIKPQVYPEILKKLSGKIREDQIVISSAPSYSIAQVKECLLYTSGQQGYGYNVEYLHSEIGKILGLDVQHNMIIIGAGNLGQALANYNFEKVGFHLIGIFAVSYTHLLFIAGSVTFCRLLQKNKR